MPKVLLAAVAAKLGARAYVGSKSAVNLLVNKKKDGHGIYFYKGGLSDKRILKVKQKCDKFIILDEEVGPACEDIVKYIKGRIWPGSEHLVNRYYVIGPYVFATAKKTLPDLRSSVFMTGWPRIDLWRKEFRSMYASEIERIKDKYGKYILFTSDFYYNSTNKISHGLNLYKNIGIRWKSLQQSFPEETIIANNELAEYQSLMKIFVELDSDKNCPQIIIRPHPVDDHAEWQRLAKLFKRIRVIFEGDVSPWIYASSAVLHRGCTSAVQAYMNGIPTGYMITKNKWIKKALPFQVSEHLENYQDILKFLLNYINKKPNDKMQYIDEFSNMIHLEKKLASEIIAEDMLSLSSKPANGAALGIADVFTYQTKCYLMSLRDNIRKYYPKLSSNQSIGIAQKSQKMSGGITKNEIQVLLNTMMPGSRFKLRKIINDCVEIETGDDCGTRAK